MKFNKLLSKMMRRNESPLTMKHYACILINGKIFCCSVNNYGMHAEVAVLDKLSRFEGKDR